ncbi:hypothetical protein PAE9249_04754 [Paenibacillus sp. CECT 9249]|uniref:S-layer homology domain-containing protein n=1 Tax=Paenibacillus sp. CECT 9249 TaxID=2845385 RepID=UPI001E60A980|nr:S-layer homology domain-containing protein [Paenibacillus sp. CECT 9249]CAH0122207.1 hypothetical protein PAE9249_04754 [Paenibacillus sp. CECT 9249]
MKAKVISFTLAAMMVLGTGSAAYAEVVPGGLSGENSSSDTSAFNQTQSSSAPLFSDVKSGFWAEKHITKLALEKILLGNNGKFRPNDPVTQQEAVTMAIRFMNLEQEVNSGNSVAFQEEFKVGTYFKPYVALAFQKGLLDKNEEMTEENMKEPWGDKKATREWVTKILVRAIGKQNEAQAAMTTQTSFADNGKISPSALGYVNAAVSLKLTTGLEGNKFEPQGNVTRAQLATFFSRGGQYIDVNYSNVYEGVITNLTSTSLDLYDQNGKIHSFARTPGAAYFRFDAEYSISASDVKPYLKVSVIENEGAAAYVEILDLKPQMETTDYKFDRLLTTSGKTQLLVQGASGGDNLIDIDNSVTVLDQAGNEIQLSELPQKSTIEVKRETFTQDRKIVIVQVKSAPVNKVSEGTVVSVDTAQSTVKVKDTANQEETFKVADKAEVRYKDRYLSNGLADIKAADLISYRVEDGVIVSIEVKQTSEYTVKGMLFNLDDNRTFVSYFKDNDKSNIETRFFADRVEVSIDGLAKASLDDLIADTESGDMIEVAINNEGQVTKIVVSNRKVKTLNEATVVLYDTKNNLLVVQDENVKPKPAAYTLYVDQDTKLDINTNITKLSELEAYLPPETRVNLTFIDNKAIMVQKVYKYDGILKYIDYGKQTITLTTANGKELVLPYEGNAAVFLYGKNNASFADLKIGGPVSAQLNNKQDKVGRISIKTNVQFEVDTVNAKDKKLRVKTADNRFEDYVIDSVPVFNENNELSALADLAPEQVVTIQFAGNVPTSVHRVKLTYAKVEAVDTSSQKIIVKDFEGKTQEVKLTTSYQIQRGNSSDASLSGLKAGERVEIRLDANQNTVVKVLPEMNGRSFWKFDRTYNEVYVKRTANLGEKIQFVLAPNAYIHQGDTILNVQSLQDGDKINIYFTKDKIVEIEKL